MNIRTLCLAILSASDTTGYDIRKHATDGPYSYFIDASYGAIYPALNKLEGDGCVTFRLEAQDGKPARKVYSITEKGRDELLNSLASPHAKDIFKSEFLLIAMCAEQLPRDVIEAAIKRRIEHLEASLTMIENVRETAEHEGVRWVANYGLNCLGHDLRHLHNTKNEILAVAGTDRDNDNAVPDPSYRSFTADAAE